MNRGELFERYAAGERIFSGVDLQGLDLSGIDLSGSKFLNVGLQGTNLTRANLSGVTTSLTGFENTILVEANLQDCFVEGFLNSDLRRANLDRIGMLEAPIRNCNLEGASLRDASLSEVGIRSVNLRNSVLTGTKGNFYLMDVDLTGAIGFDQHGVAGGYWNLTLPDGTFIADWEAE